MRGRRARLERDLKAGRCATDELLTGPPGFVQTAKGRRPSARAAQVRAGQGHKLLARCRIAPSKTIGGLSQRQRGDLAALVAGRPPGHGGHVTGS